MKRNINDLKIIRVAKYIRVSTDRQVKTGDSLREQDDTLTEYIKTHDNMIDSGIYIDDGISGQKLDRDDFTRLMNDVEEDKLDLIIFTKLDRWFRSLRHYLNTQEMLERHGVSWLAVSQPFFDTTTAHGRAFVAQSMTWAELEAQNDSERILAVFDNKVKNGEVLSGSAPRGFKIVDKHLVLDEEADKLLQLFQEYRAHPCLAALKRYAARELGIVLSTRQLKRIIQNPKYKGVFRDNNNYCPVLVPSDLWDDCNRLIDRNVKENKKYNYIFSGLLRCGHCGKAFSALVVKKRQNNKIVEPEIAENGEVKNAYPAYRCSNMYRKGCVNIKNHYERTLEKRLLADLKPEIEKYIAEYEISAAPAIDAEAKMREYKKKIDRLKELFVNDLISIDEFKRDRLKFDAEIEKLSNAPPPEKKDFTAIRKVLTMDIEHFYHTLTVDEKNQFWRSFIDYIELDNGHNMIIHFL